MDSQSQYPSVSIDQDDKLIWSQQGQCGATHTRCLALNTWPFCL